MHEGSYLKVQSPTTRTNIPGILAASDAVDHIHRHAITAAASGCADALDAERYLAALDDKPTAASVDSCVADRNHRATASTIRQRVRERSLRPDSLASEDLAGQPHPMMPLLYELEWSLGPFSTGR